MKAPAFSVVAALMILLAIGSMPQPAYAWPPGKLSCDGSPFGDNWVLAVSPTSFTTVLLFDGLPDWPSRLAGFVENTPNSSALDWVSSGSVDFDSTRGVIGRYIRFRNRSPYAYKEAGGSWGSLSDRSIKKDIRDFTPGLAVVEKLRPRQFKFNGKLAMAPDDGRDQIGLIAQEVEKVAPFMVSTYSGEKIDGKPVLVVDPSPLTYVLINAVKEEQQDMTSADAELDGLLKAVCSDRLHAVQCRYEALVTRTH